MRRRQDRSPGVMTTDRPAPARRSRAVSAPEMQLWEQVAAGIKPLLRHEPVKPAAPVTPPDGPAPHAPALQKGPQPRLAKAMAPPGPVDLDRRAWRRLQRGEMFIEARLDLHGLTEDGAHRALSHFIESQSERGRRCVLVITGLGLRSGGTLRVATPRWLQEQPLAARVLAFKPAELAHGGRGALYVLLRRRRSLEDQRQERSRMRPV